MTGKNINGLGRSCTSQHGSLSSLHLFPPLGLWSRNRWLGICHLTQADNYQLCSRSVCHLHLLDHWGCLGDLETLSSVLHIRRNGVYALIDIAHPSIRIGSGNVSGRQFIF
jgi:hypothetical protein